MAENGIYNILHDYIFSGGILKGGTWGGKGCQNAVSFEAHYIELALWSMICTILYSKCQYQKYYSKLLETGTIILHQHNRTIVSQIFDVIFGLLHFGIWLLVLYYKINLHSLINLLQPCHLALFIQGLGVIFNGPIGAIIGILSLPLITGPLAAILVPALDGLDQPYEKLFFFIQHYLMLVTPLFLLLRNNSCALRLISFRSIIFSNWGILVVHFFFFAVRIDVIINVLYIRLCIFTVVNMYKRVFSHLHIIVKTYMLIYEYMNK